MFPLITVLSINIRCLLGSCRDRQTLFRVPRLQQARDRRDLPARRGRRAGAIVIAVAFVLINFAVDVLYAALDPDPP
ncbi:hypothetical protein HBB16_07505 [Pseudonocardia sp. MCCB 268]|nr:hypothetical protein [Pseudonocardia cytotoxica]